MAIHVRLAVPTMPTGGSSQAICRNALLTCSRYCIGRLAGKHCHGSTLSRFYIPQKFTNPLSLCLMEPGTISGSPGLPDELAESGDQAFSDLRTAFARIKGGDREAFERLLPGIHAVAWP